YALSSKLPCLPRKSGFNGQKQRFVPERFYSSPSSSPVLDVGAPPNIDGTPAGGAALLAALPRPDERFAADRPAFAAFLAAGFLAGFLAPPAFLAAAFFFPPAFFFGLLAAFFFV